MAVTPLNQPVFEYVDDNPVRPTLRMTWVMMPLDDKPADKMVLEFPVPGWARSVLSGTHPGPKPQ